MRDYNNIQNEGLSRVDSMSKKELFLANLEGRWTARTPVWMMRQAGRYMQEYRNVRQRHSFEEICKTPEIAADVTCTPVTLFDLDAAIIFSDILFVVEPFGFKLTYEPGPAIDPSLSSRDQAGRFRPYDPVDHLSFVGDAIVDAKRCLGPDIPMIGFCGAPFTIFCFLCGVQAARGFFKPYKYMMNYTEETREILQVISEVSLEYLKMQADAGADYVQLFDTFAGELSAEEFEIWSKPYLDYIINGLNESGIPSGIFIRNSNHLIDSISSMNMNSFCVDWKGDLRSISNRLNPKILQGNLNPNLMLGPKEKVIDKTLRILESMRDYPGYIFNLGHGVLPDTPPENVRAVVQTVHAFER
ncbi:MAG TPA: uroporphyrinogen decarboxylase [candidate division Zixibacteria bacterium]|nr:uroporphyrinogen decarboxylase [candidate division Zixibacteria bacterium]HEQ98869.1 uroporphyrinogen decarboxylase [candidate division Zixibacteria bacterium]